jgi:hypothetical protein
MKSQIFFSVKNVAFAFLILVWSVNVAAQTGSVSVDEKAIIGVIETAYVDGLQNWGDIEAIRAGFHPSFELLTKTKDNQIQKLPIGQWIESVETRKAKNPEGPEKIITADIIDIDITVDAAAVKLDLIRDDKKIFTDYLLLYKFEEGWRIVGKIYYRIP